MARAFYTLALALSVGVILFLTLYPFRFYPEWVLHPHLHWRLFPFVGFDEVLANILLFMPPAFLAAYSMFTALRLYRWRMNAVVVTPRPRFLILLEDYYSVWFPIAILVASRDWLVLLAHLVLFPLGPTRAVRGIWKLVQERRYPR